MATLESRPPWNAEDDLLLKSAIEAGASLEALAKGAVRFSRKFSIGELRERWQCLLYDDDISAEASTRMVEFELSNPNFSSNTNRYGLSREIVGGSAKRKAESIRKQYYASRKRMCTFNSFDLSFLEAPDVKNDCDVDGGDCQEQLEVGTEPLDSNYMVADRVENYFEDPERVVNIVDHAGAICDNCVPEDGSPKGLVQGSVKNISQLSFRTCDADKNLHMLGDDCPDCPDHEGVGALHAPPDLPLWKTIEDVAAPEMPINVDLEVKVEDAEVTFQHPDDVDSKNISSAGHGVCHSELVSEDKQMHGEVKISVASTITGSDFSDIAESLLNLTSENEFLLMDVDGKDMVDKACCDSINSLLLNSPKDVNEDDEAKGCEPQILEPNTGNVVSNNACTTELESITEVFPSGHADQLCDSHSEVNASSVNSVEIPHSPEIHDELMNCVLNTEDLEVPCNDDIHPPASWAYPAVQARFTEVNYSASSSMNQNNSEQLAISLKNEEIPAKSLMASQLVASDKIQKPNSNCPIVCCAVTKQADLPDVSVLSSVSKQASNVPSDPCQCRLLHATSRFSAIEVLKEEGINAHKKVREQAPLSIEQVSTSMPVLESEVNLSAQDEEEPEGGLGDSDDDIPCYSDIEMMILEMDLSPSNEDLHINKEVTMYRHEDTKRKIIRLEQCARSSLQRAIASHGALGVLYGRRLKQYIKKTEVVLGRATEENEVDIDLGKEGHANKISRRQALIKMEGDGGFILKNMGKGSIFLNGREVATGHLTRLSPSSLIEIRGLSFVFEMNQKSVRRYLENITKNSQEKYTKFKWAPDKNH